MILRNGMRRRMRIKSEMGGCERYLKMFFSERDTQSIEIGHSYVTHHVQPHNSVQYENTDIYYIAVCVWLRDGRDKRDGGMDCGR
jgi:hypothetical protein